jgi:hypothetical protein
MRGNVRDSSKSVLDEVLAGAAGATDVEQTPAGRVLLRTSSAVLGRISDPVAAALTRMPAGVRLCVTTDAPWIDLHCNLTLIRLVDATQAAVFEVARSGRSLSTVTSVAGHVLSLDGTGAMSYAPGLATTIRIPLEPSGREQAYQIWLPPAAQVAFQDIRIPEHTSLRPDPDSRPRWLHYGSSISQCADAQVPSQTWPALAADSLGLSLFNVALAGQCHLDQFVARTIRDTPCDLITLKLGINVVNHDSMRERAFASAAHGFLDTVRDGHPTTPIVVITPIACPTVESLPGPTNIGPAGFLVRTDRPATLLTGALSLARIRQLLKDIVAARRAQGDLQLHLISGLDILGLHDTALLHDGLHPSAEAWPIMAQRAAQALQEVL